MRLEITGLEVRFGARPVVSIAELALGDAEIVGLAGESGSGKSMTTLAILGLAGTVGASVTGSIRLDGRELIGLPDGALRNLRGRRIAAIFQSPSMAFNPVFRVGHMVLRALRLHGLTRSEASDRAAAAMREVLLSPGPGAATGAEGPGEDVDPVHQPRPGGGSRAVRSGGGDAGRLDRGAGPGWADHVGAGGSVHRRSAGIGAEDQDGA